MHTVHCNIAVQCNTNANNNKKYIENLKYNHTGTKNTGSIYLQKKIHCIAKLHFVTLTYMKLNRNTMNLFVNCVHHFSMNGECCLRWYLSAFIFRLEHTALKYSAEEQDRVLQMNAKRAERTVSNVKLNEIRALSVRWLFILESQKFTIRNIVWSNCVRIQQINFCVPGSLSLGPLYHHYISSFCCFFI